MAYKDWIDLDSEWVTITVQNVTRITFIVVGSNPVYVQGAVGNVAPTNLDGAIPYTPGNGEKNELLSDLFPGVPGANRVFVRAAGGQSAISVQHA